MEDVIAETLRELTTTTLKVSAKHSHVEVTDELLKQMNEEVDKVAGLITEDLLDTITDEAANITADLILKAKEN